MFVLFDPGVVLSVRFNFAQTFVTWANSYLNAQNLSLESVPDGLTSGVLLVHLSQALVATSRAVAANTDSPPSPGKLSRIESSMSFVSAVSALSGGSVGVGGVQSHEDVTKHDKFSSAPSTREECVENVALALDLAFPEGHGLPANVTPDAIVDGSGSACRALLWALINVYELAPYGLLEEFDNVLEASMISSGSAMGGDESFYEPSPLDSVDAAREAVLGRVLDDVGELLTPEMVEELEALDLRAAVSTGILFAGLVSKRAPQELEVDDLDPANGLYNITLALNVGEKKLGIPRFIDPKEVLLQSVDDQSLMTYIGRFWMWDALHPEGPMDPQVSRRRSSVASRSSYTSSDASDMDDGAAEDDNEGELDDFEDNGSSVASPPAVEDEVMGLRRELAAAQARAAAALRSRRVVEAELARLQVEGPGEIAPAGSTEEMLDLRKENAKLSERIVELEETLEGVKCERDARRNSRDIAVGHLDVVRAALDAEHEIRRATAQMRRRRRRPRVAPVAPPSDGESQGSNFEIELDDVHVGGSLQEEAEWDWESFPGEWDEELDAVLRGAYSPWQFEDVGMWGDVSGGPVTAALKAEVEELKAEKRKMQKELRSTRERLTDLRTMYDTTMATAFAPQEDFEAKKGTMRRIKDKVKGTLGRRRGERVQWS